MSSLQEPLPTNKSVDSKTIELIYFHLQLFLKRR
ncbi:uncharacterized protein METZ01_LOCUS312868 [marine metagenome]|uniref:Uncharacterized protein n=1 Tax=marine metagenome TaxID=408172 RepID=A0A382NFM2_9ZZZZ